MPTPTPAQLIDFEKGHPAHSGARDELIRRELGITPPRYVVLLKRAVMSMEGIRHDALAAGRIRATFDSDGGGVRRFSRAAAAHRSIAVSSSTSLAPATARSSRTSE